MHIATFNASSRVDSGQDTSNLAFFNQMNEILFSLYMKLVAYLVHGLKHCSSTSLIRSSAQRSSSHAGHLSTTITGRKFVFDTEKLTFQLFKKFLIFQDLIVNKLLSWLFKDYSVGIDSQGEFWGESKSWTRLPLGKTALHRTNCLNTFKFKSLFESTLSL